MQNFDYKILNSKKIELYGSIQAKNEQEAKDKLLNLGYEILELKAKDQKKQKENKNLANFKFEGYQNSKFIDGNIQASSFNQALTELTQQYQIQIEKLAHENASQKEFNESKLKINNFLKRLDFHSKKDNIQKSNNLEEIYIFIESLTDDFKHYFTENGVLEIKNLQKQYIQIKNSNNKAQKVRILKSIFKCLLNDKIYKKSASSSGLKYIFKETINIFHKISLKNGISLNIDKINILLSTSSQILRETILSEFINIENKYLKNFNFKEISQDIKSIGLIGTLIFFTAIFLVNLKIINIQIPSIWYKVGILFFSVYSSNNLYNLLSKFNKKIYLILSLNIINIFLLIKI
ncbi:hypothetical protein CL656_02695 [bacterium]|mgnify:CR=1 FL=1|nr:hypothetical protein [bacterium]|tara:strand:- start:174 stop:1220 length:1047 start_codon:yes stop_codon:yes gene_type:complete